MNSIFSANEPSLGYLYQVRYGLLLLISKQDEQAKLFLEKIDDVSIETNSGLDVYQTKLHINSVANLTNSSPDLWKTLRVWSVGISSGEIDPDKCIFNLITTAVAANQSIPYLLKQETTSKRDSENILKLLLEVTDTSSNQTNTLAYSAFKALSEEQQIKMIKNICVLDSSIDLNEAQQKIKKHLCYSTVPDRIDALYQRLEGWFIGEVIFQLQELRTEITGKEVLDKILDIADSLKVDNLPADFTVSIATDEDQLSPYRNKNFVKQLELIDINPRLINHAISDFHRAYSQKSQWLREGLINAMDEITYDNKLIDDWDRKFALVEDLSEQDETMKKKAGKSFYETHYVSNHPNIHIKQRFQEQFMVVGSCQILSDKIKIGWHPKFKTKS